MPKLFNIFPVQPMKILAWLFILFCSSPAYSLPVFVDGYSVDHPSNSASFDNLSAGVNLLNYVEDGIAISAPGYSYDGFSPFSTPTVTGFHFESGGNTNETTISMADGSYIYALDFFYGDGWKDYTSSYLHWKTIKDGILTGSGSTLLDQGNTVGWTDADGFSSLLVVALPLVTSSFGDLQAIALDDLRIDAEYRTSVPEPSTLFILGTGLFLIGSRVGWARCCAHAVL
ncbi:MAG: PEP-CTERM sorting domain-containing protein [Sedimenticola sp.]|nr:PEP-CTERM sorting domain-containing protein [Sedimenticola sp.]